MSKIEGFNCCGEDAESEEACGCLPQPLEDLVTPCGTRFLAADSERMYRTGETSNRWLSRKDYLAWSKEQGLEVDPIVWYTRMGHWPIPEDALPLIPEAVLKKIYQKHSQVFPG